MPPAAALKIKHGGKIDMKYDGFNRETVLKLTKMGITCGDAKGFKDILKNSCVSLAVSLHFPGQQLDYIQHAKLRLIFEAKDWDSRHPPGSRDLIIVADGETLKLGTMALVSQGVGSGFLDDKSEEVLEVSMPYQTFNKIALAQAVEMKVGATAFTLGEKNVAALRDLNGRVKPRQ